jgi:hypothetical protein
MIENKIQLDDSIKLKIKKITEITESNTKLLLNAISIFKNEISFDIIKSIWSVPEIMDYYDKNKYDLHIFDGSDYFIKNLEKFDPQNLEKFDPQNYIPSSQDIIMCRRKTTGINLFEFLENDYNFKLFEVGGARSERKKWIHCFEGLDCVIYLVSLSSYDKRANEDDFTNRLEDSLEMFEECVNFLPNTKFYLLFNMVDLFDKKLEKNKNLKKYFQDYKINYLSSIKKMKNISKFDIRVKFNCEINCIEIKKNFELRIEFPINEKFLNEKNFIVKKFLDCNMFDKKRIEVGFLNTKSYEDVFKIFNSIKFSFKIFK